MGATLEECPLVEVEVNMEYFRSLEEDVWKLTAENGRLSVLMNE